MGASLRLGAARAIERTQGNVETSSFMRGEKTRDLGDGSNENVVGMKMFASHKAAKTRQCGS
jgi:hypothetical protein